ncbi:MAG: hypothetical protein H6606_08925 [Flavobacteriales bacterium]|nr:hypothetical protein [Flavobacteriales bacterium]
MKTEKANKMINELLEFVRDEDHDLDELVEKLKELREIAKKEEDPAIVKILRLCYEYIENNEDFDIGYMEEEGIEDMTDIEYLLELLLHSDREANRKEIREIRDLLWAELY